MDAEPGAISICGLANTLDVDDDDGEFSLFVSYGLLRLWLISLFIALSIYLIK
jgi:hypothetical protein